MTFVMTFSRDMENRSLQPNPSTSVGYLDPPKIVTVSVHIHAHQCTDWTHNFTYYRLTVAN